MHSVALVIYIIFTEKNFGQWHFEWLVTSEIYQPHWLVIKKVNLRELRDWVWSIVTPAVDKPWPSVIETSFQFYQGLTVRHFSAIQFLHVVQNCIIQNIPIFWGLNEMCIVQETDRKVNEQTTVEPIIITPQCMFMCGVQCVCVCVCMCSSLPLQT